MTKADHDENMTLFGLFQAQVRQRPSSVAVAQGDRTWTYAELDHWSAVVAEAMADAGVREGRRVLVVLPNCVELVVSLLASARLGALTVPINVRYRPVELRAVIESLQPHCTVLAESFLTNPIADRLEEATAELGADALGSQRLLVDGSRPWATAFPAADGPVREHLVAPQREDTPLICYWTSGTTGDPKGVVHDQRLVRNVWNWTTDVMGYTHEDVLVSTRPFYYISGSCWSMLGSLIHGSTLVIAQRFDAAELLELLAERGATVMLGGQSLYYTLLDSPLFPQYRDRLRLRTGFFGGTSVKPDFVATMKEQFGMPSIVQVYGMTELLGFATSTLRTDPDDVTTNTVGRPLPGFEFSLRAPDDPSTKITEVDRPGELWVRGNVLAGYLREGAVTHACDADGWFATSDVLSRRADGNWVFHSRIRDMVKVRGENVLLSEVDDALDTVPGVRRGVTFGIEDRGGRDWHVEAMVEPDGSRELTSDEVTAYCRSHLAPHKVPTAVWFLPPGTEWPVTVSGKVQRRKLAMIAADQQAARLGGDSPSAAEPPARPMHEAPARRHGSTSTGSG